MFSKIVSQILFTCSTFLLLSASLFSMERGEGPGEEKKAPVLSTEQKTAISRRSEESTEDAEEKREGDDADPNQGLARGMGGCQLADPTISHGVKKEDQQGSSLQPSGSLGMDDGMSASIPPSSFMGSPQRTAAKARVAVTPDEEARIGLFGAHNIKEFPGQVAIVSPSPGKRDLSNFHPGDLMSPIGPTKLFGSPSKIKKVDPEVQAAKMSEHAEKMAEMQQAVFHGNEILSYAENTKQAILPVYRVFNPKDAKKTDVLTQACRERTGAQMAMEMVLEDLKHSLSAKDEDAKMEVSHEDLILKLRLATAAVQETTENVKSVAEGLMGDAQYGDRVNEALTTLRTVHARGADLFSAPGSIAQSPRVAERSLFFDVDQKEILQKKIQTAETTLQYATELIPSVVEKAQRVFQECQDEKEMSDYGSNLRALHQQLKAEIALMKVAVHQAKQYDVEAEVSSEENGHFLNALNVTMGGVNQVTEQMREIVQHIEGYDEVTMVDVTAVLQKSTEIYNRYQASLEALGSR